MFIPLTVVFSQANHSVRTFTVYIRIHGVFSRRFLVGQHCWKLSLSPGSSDLTFTKKYQFNKSPHLQMCAGKQRLYFFPRASTHARTRHAANRRRTGM